MSFEADRIQRLSTYRKTPADSDDVRMDLNENSFNRLKGISLCPEQIYRYPDEQPLKELLEKNWGLPEGSVLLFNGASEAIQCSCLAFVNPGNRVTIPIPAFALTPHYLTLAGGVLWEIPFTETMEFDSEAITESLETGPQLFITASPHNPSGAVLPSSRVTGWCRRFPKTLFVIDEAYASFGNETLLKEVQLHKNLLVIRSFSKDCGLAGVRLGAAVGSAALINALSKVRTPFSINSAALSTAICLLQSGNSFKSGVRRQLLCRNMLAEETGECGLPVRRGSGNFFLVTGERAEEFHQFCLSRGVVTRFLGNSIVRISPSDKPGNEKYIKCLAEWKESQL